MLAEVSALIGELSAMNEADGVPMIPVAYVLGWLKGAAVVYGVWVLDDYNGYVDGHPYNLFHCNECGYVVADDGQALPSYCPNCGTKGAPIEAQPLGGEAAPGLSGPEARPRRSGFDGERRRSGADELSLQGEASERSLRRRVSESDTRGGED